MDAVAAHLPEMTAERRFGVGLAPDTCLSPTWDATTASSYSTFHFWDKAAPRPKSTVQSCSPPSTSSRGGKGISVMDTPSGYD